MFGSMPQLPEGPRATKRSGPRYALFTAIPFVGHLNPLLRQAEALARRGWRCAVATMSEARPHIEGKAKGVDFVDLGPMGPLAQKFRQIEEEVSREPDFKKGTWRIMRGLNAQWAPMYDGLLAALRQDRPDVMIVDFASAAGIDAGETEGLPVILNNADLLACISVKLLPPADHVPRLFSGMSIKEIGPGQRALSAALRVMAPRLVALSFGRQLNAVRATRGLPPVDVNLWHKDRLILVDSAFGLEYSRSLPPYVQMVGPMLPEEIEPLPEEYQRWLEQGPPVVYVNLGTLAMAHREQLAKMVEAFGGEEHRVLWVLRKPQHALLPELLPGNLRVIEWGPPPISILSHPNVRVFVSHCGINSVHESLYAGTPIVGIPMLADQRDMGARVEDAGVGLCVDKTRFTAEELRRAISRIMHEGSFRSEIPAIQASFRLAGGVSRAADLIERYAAERTALR
jgi:MGT family glycosyltransferase